MARGTAPGQVALRVQYRRDITPCMRADWISHAQSMSWRSKARTRLAHSVSSMRVRAQRSTNSASRQVSALVMI